MIICTHHVISISLLFLLISSWTHVAESAGRGMRRQPIQDSQEEEKVIIRAQIGSRPPRCESKCSSCGHCVAIQVPTNPQIKDGSRNSTTSSVSRVDYARGDQDSSNYKPMSWKCKCGDSIFNP